MDEVDLFALPPHDGYGGVVDSLGEVDFVVREGARVREAIQVSLDISEERTRRREFGGLAACASGCEVVNLAGFLFFAALVRCVLLRGLRNLHYGPSQS